MFFTTTTTIMYEPIYSFIIENYCRFSGSYDTGLHDTMEGSTVKRDQESYFMKGHETTKTILRELKQKRGMAQVFAPNSIPRIPSDGNTRRKRKDSTNFCTKFDPILSKG
jgi:hypothetical protein